MSSDLWVYRATVISVTDGDTVRISIDMGFHCYHIEALRLAGIDTPELFSGTNRDAGRNAKEFVQAWVVTAVLECDTAWPARDTDWPFIVHTMKDRQTFGRYIGWIQRADNGEDLAEAIIAAGYGVRVSQ